MQIYGFSCKISRVRVLGSGVLEVELPNWGRYALSCQTLAEIGAQICAFFPAFEFVNFECCIKSPLLFKEGESIGDDAHWGVVKKAHARAIIFRVITLS